MAGNVCSPTIQEVCNGKAPLGRVIRILLTLVAKRAIAAMLFNNYPDPITWEVVANTRSGLPEAPVRRRHDP